MDVIRKMVGDVLASKRVKLFLIGMLSTYLINKVGFEAEMAAKLSEGVFYGIGALIAGQTITDFASGGKTSASHPDNVAARTAE